MTEARRRHEQFTQEIAAAFRRDGLCHRLEYTGSSYEASRFQRTFMILILNLTSCYMSGGAALVSHPVLVSSGFFTLKKRGTSLESLSEKTDQMETY